MTNLDKRHLPYGNASAIQDKNVVEFLSTMQFNVNSILHSQTIHKDFLEKYFAWIQSTKNNKILGIENFSYKCMSNATSEIFDKFYLKNQHRRFRCFKAEYVYHKLAWKEMCNEWCYIEDCDLDPMDAVVISLPFANTGNEHKRMREVLSICDNLHIPVLIDCAYFGACADIEFDFSYKCITDISFSLSKTFPVANCRIGMRLTKEDNDDTLFVYDKISYVNKISAHIGLKLIENFSSDYIYDTYKDRQSLLCDRLDVIPSKTVLFGIGNELWRDYDRGGDTNRLSFHRYLHLDSKELINEVV